MAYAGCRTSTCCCCDFDIAGHIDGAEAMAVWTTSVVARHAPKKISDKALRLRRAGSALVAPSSPSLPSRLRTSSEAQFLCKAEGREQTGRELGCGGGSADRRVQVCAKSLHPGRWAQAAQARGDRVGPSMSTSINIRQLIRERGGRMIQKCLLIASLKQDGRLISFRILERRNSRGLGSS